MTRFWCMETAAYFLEKAAQCRRLADSLTDERAVDALLKLADEFEAKASAYVARKRAAHAIGLGDNVVPIMPSAPTNKDGQK
jgi:hypothetical protein